MKKILVLLLFLLSISITSKLSAQWVQCNINATGIYSFASNGNDIFAATINGVSLSTDNGLSWSQTSLNVTYNECIAVNGNNIFSGTAFYGLWRSTNYGLSWSQTNLNNMMVLSLAIGSNTIYAGSDSGFFYSTNNGVNWYRTGFDQMHYVFSLASSGNNVYAGTGAELINNGIYLSTNNGLNWNLSYQIDYRVFSLVVNGNNLFAGTSRMGIYYSTNNGLNWIHTSLNNKNIYSIVISGNNVFAGTDSSGVYLSTNNGTNWVQHNEGFPNGIFIYSLGVVNNYLIAGTLLNGAWRRYIPELLGIKKSSNYAPSQFSLYQNYPNPFNPTTLINYQLPVTDNVKLVIYDILGKEVTTLVNEKQSAGTYEVEWNASNFASGIYFYRLVTDKFTETKKMVLVK